MPNSNPRPILLGLVVLALSPGCGDDGGSPIQIGAVSPEQGTIRGGTRITITGSGFTAGGAAPNLVLIDGVSADDIVTLNDSTIEATTPPGTISGPVEVFIANDNGTGAANDLYEYNSTPVVTSISPDRGEYRGGTEISIMGSGFETLDAGQNFVFFGESLGASVQVIDDTEITVIAPPGFPLSFADVRVRNGNGDSEPLTRGYKFVGDGLLAMSKPLEGSFSVTLYYADPANGDVFTLSEVSLDASGLGGLATSPDGVIYGITGRARWEDRVGTARRLFTLDPETGEMTVVGEAEGLSANITDLTFVDNSLYGVCRHCGDSWLGTFNLDNGNYLPVGSLIVLSEDVNEATRIAATSTDVLFIKHDGAVSGPDPAVHITTLRTINLASGNGTVVADLPSLKRPRAMAVLNDEPYVVGAIEVQNFDEDGPILGIQYPSVIARVSRLTAQTVPVATIPATIGALTHAPR